METKIIKKDNITTGFSPTDLLTLAVEKNLDVEKLEKLMALQQQWEDKQAKKAYYSSLSKFQFECPPILKSKAGYDKRYYYAPLDQIIKVIKAPLFNNELTYRWEQENKYKKIIVTCIITHVSGHSEKTTLEDQPDTSGSKNAIQAMGSTVQYLRRYTLESVLGIATSAIDVDGQQPTKKTTKLNKEQSAELLIESKIEIDNFEKADELQKKGRPFLQDQVKAGLHEKDKKELEAHITLKFNELKTAEKDGEEYAKNL